jgi:Flp pilus assembly protein TadG
MRGCGRVRSVCCGRGGRLPHRDRQGVAILEFALLSIPFFLLVLGLCEVSFDLFLQEATDLALQAGARQMEIGAGTAATSETNFVQTYVCNTTAGRMLICGNFHIKVQLLTGTEDFSSPAVSTGTLPLNGKNLDLSAYDGGSTGASVFCTAPPGTLIMISAIYIGPTFLSGLLPGLFNEYYKGNPVHAVLSQVGVASEQFPPSTKTGIAPQC